MAQMLTNKFVKRRNGLDFSRSLVPYEKRHSTNLLSGYIVPVHCQFLYPGMSPDWNFGCVLESAPLISTNLDNIYVDIVTIWTPMRLVMTDWNEFLGESHTQAFTINRNVKIPKIGPVYPHGNDTYIDAGGQVQYANISRAYYAEHFIGPHVGFRYHRALTQAASDVKSESIFYSGVSVIPSRIYELNWNVFFRNENVQQPILIDKTSSVGMYQDQTYQYGLGKLQIANKLKNFYTVATPAPSLMDVNLLEEFGGFPPVGILSTSSGTVSSDFFPKIFSGTVLTDGEFNEFKTSGNGGISGLGDSPVVADLSALTVNRMYYALMEQRFANKMMKGRRAVEFYKNFFGIESSDAAHDLPQLIIQKRYPLNISQVIATSAGTDGNNTTDLGQKGAYSVTGFGGPLVKGFMASEHGYMMTYMIIRGQPSLASGIDHHLGVDSLLQTYLPEFDHIGQVGIETIEVAEPIMNQSGVGLYFGYTNAWYSERHQVSDVVGIMEPTEPLAYKTLALAYSLGTGNTVISDSFLRHSPKIIDRIFLYPVLYGTPSGTDGVTDADGEPYNSDRYQFLTQFVVKGKTAAVMSADSEPLVLRM